VERANSLQITDKPVEQDGSNKLNIERSAEGPRRSWCSNDGPLFLLRVWAMSTLIIFAFCAAWSLVTPIGAANDEPAQLVKAASVARGELLGQSVSPRSVAHLSEADRTALHDCYIAYGGERRCNPAVTIVTVPESFASLRSCITFAFVPSGSCVGLHGSARGATVATYVGHYPPLYYGIVGLPSLAWNGDAAVYLMRMVSGLLSALFLGLALALATVWSRSRTLVLAVVVAVTPTAIIFGSVVNPSGLEISSSICVWTGGLILVLDRTSHPPPSLIASTAIASIVMVLMRGLSPLWLALIAVVLAVVAPRSLPVLIRLRTVRIAAGAVTFAGVVAVVYIFWAHALSVSPLGQPVPAGTSEWGVVELALGSTRHLVGQFIGPIGESANPPTAAIGLWLFSASAIVVLGLVASQRRYAAVIIGLVVTSLVVPVALMVSQARVDGVVWQARDGFPLYAGIILVAGAVVGRNVGLSPADPGVGPKLLSVQRRRLVLLVATTMAIVQFADFFWGLRRYTVGLGSVLNPFARVRGGWDPPISSLALVLLALVVTVAYWWWIRELGSLPMASRSRQGVPQ
jgi:hypothetical protein